MDLTEEKIFEAFGLESPGENGPENAEPADAEESGETTGTPAAEVDDGTSREDSPGGGNVRAADKRGEVASPTDADEAEEGEGTADGDEGDDSSGAARQSGTRRAASPTRGGTESGEDGGEDAEESEEAGGAPKGAQSVEERRQNAARRRERERQAAIDAAVAEALRQRDAEHEAATAEFFRQAGLSNPYTKQPITSMEEFRAWKKAQDEERVRQELRSGKLTPETLRGMVNEAVRETAGKDPSTPLRFAQNDTAEATGDRKGRPYTQGSQGDAGPYTQGAESADAGRQFEREVQEQLAEIRKSEPQVKELADLMKQPWSGEFYEYVKRGNNFRDAYYLATRQQQAQRAAEAARQAAEAARQQAMRSVQSKEHLRRTGVGGKAGADVSAEERKYYRLFNEGATDDQIQAFANRQRR